MERKVEQDTGGKLRLTFTLAPLEHERFAAKALAHLGGELKLDGFRPGHVPPTVVKTAVKPETLEQETLQQAIREVYPALVKAENLQTVGAPELVAFTASPFSFTLTVAKVPEISLGKWDKVKVKRKPVAVEEREVDELIQNLRDARASEVAVTRAAQLGDYVEMDFEISVDNVVPEGGQQSKYGAVLGKHQLVPGFEDNVVGVAPGTQKQFELTFPQDYRKDLAGKQAQVKLTLHQVFERQLPELTDEFAHRLGRFGSVADLRTKLKGNLLDEANEREENRVEREMLDALVKVAEFGEIPELLVVSEVDKMLHEFRHSLEERSVGWADYLTSIRKDEVALKQEFRNPAVERVKVALIVRMFSRQEHLEADELAVDEEIAKTLEQYGGDSRAQEQLKHPEYRDYVKMVLTNRRVIEWLKAKLVE